MRATEISVRPLLFSWEKLGYNGREFCFTAMSKFEFIPEPIKKPLRRVQAAADAAFMQHHLRYLRDMLAKAEAMTTPIQETNLSHSN